MLTIEHKQQDKEANVPATQEAPNGTTLHFSSGLLGFEANKQFELISDDELSPFQWLNGKDADQSFLVIPPAYAIDNYNIEISDDDAAMLGLENPKDAVVLCISTYHLNENVTINLKGPIIYNQLTGEARQVVPLNAAELPLTHPMGN